MLLKDKHTWITLIYTIVQLPLGIPHIFVGFVPNLRCEEFSSEFRGALTYVFLSRSRGDKP